MGSREIAFEAMGLRPLLGANFAAMAFAAAPITLRWSALIIILTTMMMGGNAHASPSFQYSGKPNLEFFLTQCRVRAAGYRVRELPLANVPAWQDVNGADLELSEVFDRDSRPANIHQAVWNDLARHAYRLIVPLIPQQHSSILVGAIGVYGHACVDGQVVGLAVAGPSSHCMH